MAPLETVVRKAVTGAGAPWYTSGAHMWKGATASLNPAPMTTMAKPPSSSGFHSRVLPASTAVMAVKSMVPSAA